MASTGTCTNAYTRVHTQIKNSIKPLELGVWRGSSFDKVPAIRTQVQILSIHVRCQAWKHRCSTLALEVVRCEAGLLALLVRQNNQHFWPSQACTLLPPTPTPHIHACAHFRISEERRRMLLSGQALAQQDLEVPLFRLH